MYIYIFVDNVERGGSRHCTGWRGLATTDGVVVVSGYTMDPKDRMDRGHGRMQLRITRAGVIVRTMPGLLLVILSRHCTIVSGAILNREIKAKVEWIRGGGVKGCCDQVRAVVCVKRFLAYPLISWKLIYIVQRWIMYIGLFLSSILCVERWFSQISWGRGDVYECIVGLNFVVLGIYYYKVLHLN